MYNLNTFVSIAEDEPPKLFCPDSWSVYLESEEQEELAVNLTGHQAVATDFLDNVTIVYEPAKVIAKRKDVGSAVSVKVTATDLDGNQAECQFQVFVKGNGFGISFFVIFSAILWLVTRQL